MSTIKSKRSEQSGGAGHVSSSSSTAPLTITKPTNGQSTTTATKVDEASSKNTTSSSSRLVFGLSSRTNRLKHDEYVEKRSIQQKPTAPISQQQYQESCDTSSNKSPRSTAKTMNENGSASDNKSTIATQPVTQTTTTVDSAAIKQQQSSKKTIRASKYGNFYKPQDLVVAGSPPPNRSPATVIATESSPAISSFVGQTEPNSTGAKGTGKKQLTATSGQLRGGRSPDRLNANTNETTPITRKKSGSLTSQVDTKTAPLSSNSSLNTQTTTKASISPTNTKDSPSSDNAKDTSKTPIIMNSLVQHATEQLRQRQQSPPPPPSQQEQQLAVTRMQFNIPPPRQVSTSNKSSVVSYAKSRIYDKPVKQILSNPPAGRSLLESGTIPESILSGFKPPKQVNVSKAREKWEGGEPFAKCKSRQRLAAQACKKLLHGTWSMTSVVATQQLQFQQALANSSSTIRYNVNKNEPPVKILTLGSVLERVQQFEKAPGSISSSGSSSSSLSDESSLSSFGGDNNEVAGAATFATVSGDDEVTLTIGGGQSTAHPVETTAILASAPSKQALYKTRVASIQTSSAQTNHDQLTLMSASPLLSTKSPQVATTDSSHHPLMMSGRRLSLRRRSSTTTSNNSSIPKFYHPNGKPNTYEIELQKKNIVACFDKFPDRKALLSAPAYKRHFHSIALACGFSEYFKEPLYRYVKHHMTQSNLLHGISPGGGSGGLIRKQSSTIAPISMMTNGTTSTKTTGIPTTNGQQQQTPISVLPAKSQQHTKIPLTKAASIDNSTMEKIQSQTYITCEQFLVCWRNMIGSCYDNAARFVHLLTMGKRNYLVPDDFVSLIQSIIEDHPGLKFLRAAPDFHMRYIQTVIARIYFCVNKSWTNKLSLSEIRRSNLLAVLKVLSQEEDINQITDYFSYEHFYVIYCKFWNLDQDHDLLISKEDLARHNDAAISSRIIERIFMGIVSKQIQQTGKMSYSDFVWFLIAEEDKKHPRSIEYWFRLMDIDGDGYISMYEMEYFYYEQMKRLEMMNIEALPFLDSACQILDLVNPKEKNKISLSDLKRTKMATIFFDTFINLEKYLEHESREFVSTRDIVQDGVIISDWDRYASEEYESLVTEESSV